MLNQRITRLLSLSLIALTAATTVQAGISLGRPVTGIDPILIAKRHNSSYGENQSIGRELYTGNAPRILNPSDLELYVSKTMLTVRAKAWISTEQELTYPAQMILYWNGVREAFENDSMSFVPLTNMAKLAANTSDKAKKAEFQLVSKLYSKESMDSRGIDIYAVEDAKAYKAHLLLALLRSYTLDSTTTLEDGLHLVDLAKAKNHEELNRIMPKLLERQFPDNLTISTERTDHLGFLTFVYPIAATTAGPFSIDMPGVYHLGDYEGSENRNHSVKWNDEFGGMPFMQYTSYGIAFHGPITQFVIPSIKDVSGSFNFWYLRRGYVSHGCHRMDPNDLLELRAMLPAKILSGVSPDQLVQVVTKVYPDTDVIDGKQVVFNVDYYTPTVDVRNGETVDNAVERNNLKPQRAAFLTGKIVNLGKDPQTGRKDVSIQDINADTILFNGISPLKVEDQRVVNLPAQDNVELKNYAFRGTRVVQYEEAGATYTSGSDDYSGRFPPSYFQQEKYLKNLK